MDPVVEFQRTNLFLSVNYVTTVLEFSSLQSQSKLNCDFGNLWEIKHGIKNLLGFRIGPRKRRSTKFLFAVIYLIYCFSYLKNLLKRYVKFNYKCKLF